MNVLLAGAGKGSWTIRGEQLGAAIGARVRVEPSRDDWAWADLVVIVKKAWHRLAPAAHAYDVPIVWDAVDCWQQPADHPMTEVQSRTLLKKQLEAIRPILVIGATDAQARAATAVSGVKAVYLTHHSRPGLVPQAPRQNVQTVAYEGNALYLGAWAAHLQKACQARGWSFLVNPSDLLEADVVVALREGPWDGYMPRAWKSGVKLVNALAAGRPVLTQASSAQEDIGGPGSIVETPAALDAALDCWASHSARREAYEVCLRVAPEYQLPVVAARYRSILERARADA